MYKEHQSCTPPSNPEIRAWRYMDLTKLLSILENRELWFANVTELDDPLEGLLNHATVKKFREMPEGLTEEEIEEKKGIIEGNLRIIKEARTLLNVSCWHMNEQESAAMWQLYLRSNEGVSIQTTYDRLKNCFRHSKQDVHIGVVKYIDEDDDTLDWTNVLNYALNKRKSFEHEKELRALFFAPSSKGGHSIEVDLHTLIEKIYISPSSPKWVFETIEKILDRYDLPKGIAVQSEMFSDPLY